MHQTIHPKNRKHAEVPSDIDDPAIRKYSDQMRRRSGSVDSRDPLVSFLYTLMRDHLTPGRVEEIMLRQIPKAGETTEFSNGFLANYAQDIAARLVTPTHLEIIQASLSNLDTSDQDLVKRGITDLQRTIESYGDAGVIALALVWAETLTAEKIRLSAIIKETPGDQA